MTQDKEHNLQDMGDGFHWCSDCGKTFKTHEIRNYVGTNVEDLKSYHEELNELKRSTLCNEN